MEKLKNLLSTAVIFGSLLVVGCQPYHRFLHSKKGGIGRTTIDVGTNPRCSHIASMFKPDVVQSTRVNVPLVAGGSYYYSESYVRVTEPLLVTINQFLLQACIQRELGEITAKEYAQVYRDNSARFIALASGFSAAPTPNAAAAEFDESGLGESGSPSTMAGEIRAEVVSVLSSLGGSQEQVKQLLARMQRQISDERAGVPLASSVLALLLVQPEARLAIPDEGSPRMNRSAELIQGIFVVFDTNKANLSQDDLVRIASFAKATCCQARYFVYGFADVRGTSDLNLALSRLRALKVGNALRDSMPEASIIEVGLGKSDSFGDDMQDNRIVYVTAVRSAAISSKTSSIAPALQPLVH